MSRRLWFARVASGAALSLAASTFVLVAQPTQAVQVPARDAGTPAKVISRPDRVSAMLAARAQGSRVEDLSARTPTSSTYANDDGTWSVETYTGVVRSKVDGEKWVPIDPSVEKRGDQFAPRAVPFDAAYSDGGDKKVGAVTTPGGSTIRVGWPTKLPTPQTDGDTLTYRDAAAPGADLVVDSFSDGFDYSVVLDGPPAARAPQVEYRVPFSFAGLDPTVGSDGAVVFRDGKRRVATMTAPVMWDSAAPADGAEHAPSRPVDVSVEGTGDSRTLVLKPDMDYLRDHARTWPVVIDPQVTLGVAGDTWVANEFLPTNHDTSPELRVGSINLGITKSRTLLDFDYTALDSIPAGAAIASAQLSLSNFQTGNCAGNAVRMSRITGTWTKTGVTWNNQPTVTADGSSTTTASYGATGCPTETTVNFDATAIVTAWRGGADRRGVEIAADNEGATPGYRKYRSLENGDASKAPKLSVTYGSRPNTPTGLTTSPGYTGYVTSLTPTLSATVTDPDTAQVRGFFQVLSGSTVVWSGYSSMATSGAQVSVTVPSGTLSEGATYTVKAYGDDGELQSTAAVGPVTFKVDTIAPTVTISSTAYTNGAWRTGAPVSDTLTYNGSSDTAGFYVTVDGVDYSVGTNGVSGSGDFSKTWTPPNGWTTIDVAPVDKAGNRGATVSFNFGTGAPEFTVPDYWAESPASFPVQINAPSGASVATLSWQVYGESTWHAATQVTAGGTAWNGSITSSGGRSFTPTLLWAATAEALGSGSLQGPALVMIKACFSYPSSADQCTSPRPVILTASARGGNFPEAQVGPASVGLVTGEAEINDVDAADTKVGLGRIFDSLGDATITSGLFGPGWSDPAMLAAPSVDAKASVIDNRAKDGSLVIVDPDSGSQAFTLKQGSGVEYEPVQPTGDATKLTFIAGTGGQPDKLQLARPLGSGSVTTTWTLNPSDTGGDPAWTVADVDGPGTAGDLSVTSASGSQRPVWIRESDPTAAATCTTTTQTVGCQGLKIAYTGTGAATRVLKVERVIGAATQSGVVTKPLATYSYDGSGRLATVCSAAPAAGTPPLCTTYAYTTVSGRTLLSQLTLPGLKPWRFTYDTTGRLTTVKRERPAGSDAVWSVDYSLTPSTSGLPDLSPSTAAQWGQSIIPTKVYAVYEPYSGAADVTKAHLFYTTADGTTTNTASYGSTGWAVSTNWYNATGDVVRSLDANAWLRVKAAPLADRPRVAEEASSFTVYNTWGGPDLAGTRIVDEYGPSRTSTLNDGTIGLFRSHTHTTYDDDPAADPNLIADRPGNDGLGLAVVTVQSVSSADRIVDHDQQTTSFDYSPAVAGDGNGWLYGVPTKSTTTMGTESQTSTLTRLDSEGRPLETQSPGAAIDGSGAGVDAHTTVTNYYRADGSGECGGKPEWSGLTCTVGPPSNASASMPTIHYTDYDDALNPTKYEEVTDGTVVRKVQLEYDDLGRVIADTRETVGSSVSNETSKTEFAYDPVTGLESEIDRGQESTSSTFDTWGRAVGYTDAGGMTTSTTYDSAGRVGAVSSSLGSTAYSYDDYGSLASVDVSGVGTFQYQYGPDGSVDDVTYPNGLTAHWQRAQDGSPTSLTYAKSGTSLLAFSAESSVRGAIESTSSIDSSQAYKYDIAGRLTSVEDSRDGRCVTRTYGYNLSSNRTSKTTYDPAGDGSCQHATPDSTATSTYGANGRVTNAGYSYDALGRTTSIPANDTAGDAAGPLQISYHANDMVASLSQTVNTAGGGQQDWTRLYDLDPEGRTSSISDTVDGQPTSYLRYTYAGSDGSPAAVSTSADQVSWQTTSYVSLPGVGLVASKSGTSVTYHLSNIHGDVVATMDTSPGAAIADYVEYDEFGGPITSSSLRFGWLGSRMRATDSVGGLLLMGARLYNPRSGLFTTPDPVRDANRTPYGYPEDPMGSSDVTGQYPGCGAENNCKYMLSACIGYAGAGRCLQLMGNLRWLITYSQNAKASGGSDLRDNPENAGRHFAFVVFSIFSIGVRGAWAVSVAHEHGSNPRAYGRYAETDSDRDYWNNVYVFGWYDRHKSYASHFWDGGRTDHQALAAMFWHGVDLWQRGYMNSICSIGHNLFYVAYGRC